MEPTQRKPKAAASAYDEEILLPIKTVLFEFCRHHGQKFSDGALIVLSMIYAELDRLPRVTIINETTLALRIGRSRTKVRRALKCACNIGLAKKLGSSKSGVRYRLFDPRDVAVQQSIDASDPQMRLGFVEIFDDESDKKLRIAGTIGGADEAHGSDTGSVQLELIEANEVDGCGIGSVQIGESNASQAHGSDTGSVHCSDVNELEEEIKSELGDELFELRLKGADFHLDGDVLTIWVNTDWEAERAARVLANLSALDGLNCEVRWDENEPGYSVGRSVGTEDAKTLNVNVQENVFMNVNVERWTEARALPSLDEFQSRMQWLVDSVDLGGWYAWNVALLALMIDSNQVVIEGTVVRLSESQVGDAIQSTKKHAKIAGKYFSRAIQNKIREAAGWPEDRDFDNPKVAEVASIAKETGFEWHMKTMLLRVAKCPSFRRPSP